MKRIVAGMIFVIGVALIASPSWAGVRPGSFEVGAFFGGFMFDGSEFIDSNDPFNGDHLGARLAYHFTEHWSGEFTYERIDTQWMKPFFFYSKRLHWQEISFDLFHLDVLYHFPVTDWFVPYLSAGGGGAYQDQEWPGPAETKPLLNYGAGLKFFLTKNLLIRADARHVFILDSPKNGLDYSIGLGYLIGKRPPTDADLDGVSDKLDACPDTPLGVVVDAKGCPLDADGDGVPDFRDQCPDLAGVPENYGCPAGYGDADGDGVANELDRCPDTPQGALVDPEGCPLDSDGDGVFDGIDACPETSDGVEVGPDGCPVETAAPVVETTVIGLSAAMIAELRRRLEPEQVRFDFDSSSIKADFSPILEEVAQILKEAPEAHIELAGHASAEGTAEYNEALSQRRAQAVMTFLISRGIPAASLSAVGYGESKPIASNETEAGRRANRRVEFSVVE